MYSSYSVAAAVCSVVFPVLASLAVGIRLRARKIKSLSYKIDDYVILIALVGYCSVSLFNSVLIQASSVSQLALAASYSMGHSKLVMASDFRQ